MRRLSRRAHLWNMPCRCPNMDCIKGLILINSLILQGITSLQGHNALIIQLRHSSPAGRAGYQTTDLCSVADRLAVVLPAHLAMQGGQ